MTTLEGWQPDGSGVLLASPGIASYDDTIGPCGQAAYGARFALAGAPDATLTAWAFVSPRENPGEFEVWWLAECAVTVCTGCGRRIQWSDRVEHWLVAEDQPVPKAACWPHTPWHRTMYCPDDGGEWYQTVARCEKSAREAAEILATTRRVAAHWDGYMFFEWDGAPA